MYCSIPASSNRHEEYCPRILNRVRKQHHLDFLAIMEPMVSLDGRFMARRLGFPNVVSNFRNQIWFFWGPDVRFQRRGLWDDLQAVSVGVLPWMVGECALVDASHVGSPYTWYSRQLRQRLDRVLISDFWVDVFPKMQVTHLEVSKSDHRGLLVEADYTEVRKASSFRFQQMWTTNPGFVEVVLRNRQYPMIGSGMVRLQRNCIA
ncbi:hypothetical protein Salat_1458100 [Sesamum alatum]|uniref:Uncharacterized protein n=1 Tax=Sesamum alatum TaxID=300844 RepID=A0AAE1YB20_9LAMI|nr:hypothetical protein Salat_1458100 [Sesamum alatum]